MIIINGVEKFIAGAFAIIALSLILRFYQGTTSTVNAVGTNANEIFKTLSMQGVGYA